MTGYFRSCWNFKFEKSSIGQWLKSQKDNLRTRVNFGLKELEIIYRSIKRVEFFLCHVNFMVENFLGS